MRRGAEAEGVQHAAELLLDHRGVVTGDLEGLEHDLGLVVPDRARAQLIAVADDVVLIGADGQRVLGLQGLHPALRHREGVVAEVDLLLFFRPFEHGEVDDPAELELLLVDQLQLRADAGAGQTGELGEDGGVAGGEEGGVALAQTQACHQGLGRLLTQVLGDRTAPGLLIVRPEDVAQTRLAFALRPRVHAVAEGARTAGRGRDGPDGVLGVRAEDLGEQTETAVAEVVRHVLHLNRVTQVRLVRAVPLHRLGIGQTLKALVLERLAEVVGEGVDAVDRRNRLALAELVEDAVHQRLDGGEDVFLRDEAHLDVELVEFQRTVGAQVFVAEAGRDLEVAVEARHHQQLLELLRSLRQGVELAWVHARRHQEVARAFRRRGRQDRGLVLKEALLDHALADRVDHLGAQDDVLVQGLAAQIQEAVLEADFLRILRLAKDRQRQFGGFRQHFNGQDADFDLAGGQVGVGGFGRAADHFAVDLDDAFGAQALDSFKARRLRVQHQLGQAVVVAQVDEQQAAVVALAVNPARQTNIRARIRRTEGAAGMGAIGVHDRISSENGCRTA
ncbi:hypothetical protein D3C85_922680 [compost metagenome]